MSFNFGLGILPDTSVEDVLGAAFPAHEPISFPGIEHDSMAIGVTQLGPHMVLIDRSMSGLEGPLGTWADDRGRPAYQLIFGGVVDTYVLQRFGHSSRLRVRSEGEQVIDDDDPLPGEAEAEAEFDDEDRHVALVEMILGRSFRHVMEALYRLLDEREF